MFENLFSIGGLSIERLKSFIDVAERGSIARVADGDPSRQSLISRQIGELESFFGVELTKRKGKAGFLCAYRWDAEASLDPGKFITTKQTRGAL